MEVLIPFKPVNPKSRLSDVLSLEERKKLVRVMLLDVLDVLNKFDCSVKVLSSHPFDLHGVEVCVDSQSLDDAINSRIGNETAVIMSDLVLLNEKTVEKFFNTEGDVVIAPGRRGGTNMLLIRDNRFRVSYHYCSFLKHIAIAERLGLKAVVFDSFYASVDVDSKDDLLEVLIHGKGKRTYEYLKSIGFDVKFDKDPKLVRYGKEL